MNAWSKVYCFIRVSVTGDDLIRSWMKSFCEFHQLSSVWVSTESFNGFDFHVYLVDFGFSISVFKREFLVASLDSSTERSFGLVTYENHCVSRIFAEPFEVFYRISSSKHTWSWEDYTWFSFHDLFSFSIILNFIEWFCNKWISALVEYLVS